MLRNVFFVLLGTICVPHTAHAFELESEGEVVWVADGDSFRFEPDDASMWYELRGRALARDRKTEHSLRVSKRFHSDQSFLVRLGNIDTPESAPPGRGPSTPEGRRAEAFVKALLEGKRGTLYCWAIGHYGRPICSFWTADWELGQVLIEKGYSKYETRYGKHPLFHKAYLQAERER